MQPTIHAADPDYYSCFQQSIPHSFILRSNLRAYFARQIGGNPRNGGSPRISRDELSGMDSAMKTGARQGRLLSQFGRKQRRAKTRLVMKMPEERTMPIT
jgi:hypothetical protein